MPPNGRSVKSVMAAIEEDYLIPMSIFDSRTLTRTTWRESLKWDAACMVLLRGVCFRHVGTHPFAGTAQ